MALLPSQWNGAKYPRQLVSRRFATDRKTKIMYSYIDARKLDIKLIKNNQIMAND